MPGKQVVQAVAWLTVLKLPSAQEMHRDVPVPPWYVPCGQGTHLTWLSLSVKVPGEHWMHVDAAVESWKDPAGQSLQKLVAGSA